MKGIPAKIENHRYLALRFLSLLHREPTDYVDVSRRLYTDQSIDEIFDHRWPMLVRISTGVEN